MAVPMGPIASTLPHRRMHEGHMSQRLPAGPDVLHRVSGVIPPGRVAHPHIELGVVAQVDRVWARPDIESADIALWELLECHVYEGCCRRLPDLSVEPRDQPILEAVSAVVARD